MISVSWLKVWWTVYNHQLFDGLLTRCSFDIVAYPPMGNGAYQLGQFTPGEISISVDIVCVDIAKSVLLHEMVHQWQYENGHRLDHGAKFKEQAARLLLATGLDI